MSPSIPHRFTGNSGLTLHAVDGGRRRQGRREGGRTQASSHRFFLGQSKRGFPGSFLSGGSYLGTHRDLESKELCAVLIAWKPSGYFLLSTSQKGHLLRLPLPVLDGSQAQHPRESNVRRKEIWRCRGGLCWGGEWDFARERQLRSTETLSRITQPISPFPWGTVSSQEHPGSSQKPHIPPTNKQQNPQKMLK